MLVDDVGDVTITNDGATILKLLEVEHPAAKARPPPSPPRPLLAGPSPRPLPQATPQPRAPSAQPVRKSQATSAPNLRTESPPQILVELAELQDQEVGDGTTSVVIIAAELLKRANVLVRNKIHPTSIISGYRLAMRESCKYITDHLAVRTDKLGTDSILNAARTSMNSKIIGMENDFFAQMVVDAITSVKSIDDYGNVTCAPPAAQPEQPACAPQPAAVQAERARGGGGGRYPLKAINVLKAHGKSARESTLLDGYALNMGRAAQGMVQSVKNARIACLDVNLQKSKMQFGVQVLVTDPKELERIREREFDITKERIGMLLAAGANVVFTTKGIDDMALKYFVEAGAIACRRVKKEDLRRIAKCTGASVVLTFGDMEGNESFDASLLGAAAEVSEERVSDDDMVLIKGCKNTKAVTMLLRGANDYMLDEMDRSLHDALCIVKRTLESGSVVAGGGAVEAALSIYLETLATTLGSREQLAIAEFAEAMLVIPKVRATRFCGARKNPQTHPRP